ncbi:uncharacterized protein DDB_G0283697 [Contarinia nasturtii]|uniref:uncharacterized protein DDB_G0283697 n=1 Tax=Contarinia nasturtii TaxID=265458 RepID=UPI0012D3B221|nr:uncharacterized protein DDB_G0283697 [Contarinia nasturtii]
MIKGKFYAGLPSEMMTRGKTVNRQQTHFFWPDETDAESVTSRSKRIVSKPAPITTNNNNNTDTTQSDIKPKELVRKQLSSGIQFYDNVNAKTPESRRRRFKKIDNINLNNNNGINFQPEKKKLETFSSKIEFYDFEHENNAKNEKPVKSINVEEMRKDQEIKPKNESHEMNKKRISFQTAEKTKGILKNNSEEKKPGGEKVLVKPLPKRGLLPKNLSKSVENISKMVKNIDESDGDKKPEKLSTIIKEVKNLNLSQGRKVDDYERNSYHRGSNRNEARRNNDYDHYYSDKYENKGYRDDERRYRNDERSRDEPYRYNNDYDDRGDRFERGDRGYVEHSYERSQRSSFSQPPYEHRQPARRHEESPIRGRRSPNYDRYDNHYEPKTESREYEPRHTSTKKPISRKTEDRYYDEAPVRNVRHEEDEYSTCISRKPTHVPQHLRTNILFSGKVGPQAQRPMSVRNSAVTRVGVGLPDYE